MASAFIPDCWYGKKHFKTFWKRALRSDILCVQKRLFNLSVENTINVLNKRPWVRCAKCFCRTNNVISFEFCSRNFSILKRRKNHLKTLLGICIAQHVQTKSVFALQLTKTPVFLTVESSKPAFTCWIFLLRTRNRQLCCLVVMVHIARKSHDYNKKPSPFSKSFLRYSQSSTPKPEPIKGTNIPFMA